MGLLELGLIFMLAAQAMAAVISPHVCLDIGPELLPCDYQWVTGEDTSGETLGNFLDDVDDSRGVFIIYQLMGCIPFRLPYALPNCKTEDFLGRLVQVRKIIPYAVSRSNGRHYPLHVKKMRIWPEDEDRDSLNQITDDSDSIIPMKLMKKRKKVRFENLFRKSRQQKNTDNVGRRVSVFHPVPEDFSVKRSFKFPEPEYWNHVDSDIEMQKNRRQSRSDLTKWGVEFPYGEAVPFDPEKHWMLLHHRPEASDDESEGASKMLKKRLIEFPYSKAIPFNPKKHRMLLNK